MGGGLNAGEGAGVTVCVRQWKSSLLIEVDQPFLMPTHIDPDLALYFEAVG